MGKGRLHIYDVNSVMWDCTKIARAVIVLLGHKTCFFIVLNASIVLQCTILYITKKEESKNREVKREFYIQTEGMTSRNVTSTST